jgi:Ca-activated chloride channel homolog
MDRATVSPGPSIKLRWAACLLLIVCAAAALADGQPCGTIRSGTLVFTVAEGEPVEIPRLRTDVKVDVKGIVARVELRQHFRNPSEQWAEGIYAFPLPANAAIERITTVQDGKLVSDARRKVTAKQLYDGRRGGMQQMSLRRRGQPLFRAAMPEIAPRATLEITITYLQLIDHALDRQRLRVPLAANQGPIPDLSVANAPEGNDSDTWVHIADVPQRRSTAGATQTVSLRVNLDAGAPVADVISRNHAIVVSGRERPTVTMTSERVAADADFELEWSPDAHQIQRMPLARAAQDSGRLLPISAD